MNKIYCVYKAPEIAICNIANLSYLTVQSSFISVMQLLGLIGLFFVILMAAVFLTRWLGNVGMGMKQKQNISVVETYKLTQNKYIQIIKITDKYIAIALSKDSVEKLAELDPTSIKFESKQMDFEIKNFKDLKDYIKSKIKNEECINDNNCNGEKDSFSKILNKLKKQ